MQRLDKKSRGKYAEEILDFLRNENIPTFRKTFLDLHPMDQATIFTVLDLNERALLYHYISAGEFSSIFQELDYEVKLMILNELHEAYAADMLNEMDADDAASFLAKLPENTRENLLLSMDDTEEAEVRELMTYPEETAGSIMTKDYIQIKASFTTREVLEYLQKEGPSAETIYYLYVVNENEQLAGVLSLRDLITHEPSELVEKIMSTRLATVTDSDDQEEVARMIQHYDLLALPVLTKMGKLVGIITVDDAIDVIEEETTEDVGEFSAVRGATDEDVTAFQAAKKRAPWIVLLMFLGMITASTIEQFEETLEAIVLLAVFIPLIMDSAGNTGTQSLAVIVRGLATGSLDKKGVAKTLWREFKTGMMIGLASAIAIVILIYFLYGNTMLAVVVAVSIFLSLSLATVIGAIFPLIINKLKLDPAIASGPFITTINDILGLLIYFTIATSLLHYL
ncbi:magnesium transporter [Salicibibacter kimchii]|uniref:Magnesium transporter MgtE n=1 Tax=Salicibibacter kimchii TaxID=2099786 RepID=A0A345C1M4_9BACI|nr:magnesium transporter [Salicibibacter kimchii]AXF57105.1 magnesium transporter [Salicibibacter kimchii]